MDDLFAFEVPATPATIETPLWWTVLASVALIAHLLTTFTLTGA